MNVIRHYCKKQSPVSKAFLETAIIVIEAAVCSGHLYFSIFRESILKNGPNQATHPLETDY